MASRSRTPSIKAVTESNTFTSIPSAYIFTTKPNLHFQQTSNNPEQQQQQDDDSLPTIDFSLLSSTQSNQRSKIIHDLGKAVQGWGFFQVINHDVPETLIKAMIDVCDRFFNLTEEEKIEFEGKHVLDPIRCGTSFNPDVDNVLFWRDFLKVFVHPQFHSPHKPNDFSEISMEYSKRTREVARELIKGISESLGLEANHIHRVVNWDNGLTVLAANFYPPCPQPEFAMGMPPHSDHGLLTILTQNDMGGLQVKHKGKWVIVNPMPNAFLVNVGDHMEILSNGKYKSVIHRAIVNNRATRISIAMANGPSLDTVVRPLTELIDEEEAFKEKAYIEMGYKQYLELQQSNRLRDKSCLGGASTVI